MGALFSPTRCSVDLITGFVTAVALMSNSNDPRLVSRQITRERIGY